MNERVLLVDDDERILSGYLRTLRGHFQLDTALTPERALEMIASAEPYPVVVSDMRMPNIDGLELLRRTRQISPDSVLLILTGNADLRTAIDAVNEGDIFRFLEKPCPPQVFVKILSAAVNQYRLKLAERDLLQKTLHGSIKMLTDVLALVNPEAFSTASRITLYVKHVVAELGLKDTWRFEMAAMLSHLGCVVLPTDTLEAVRLGRRLNRDQATRFARHPEVARFLLRHIPRLESIAAIVGRQSEPLGSHAAVPLSEWDEETLGAQILKMCIRFEALVRSGRGHVAAMEMLLGHPEEYRAELVHILAHVPVESLPCEPATVAIADLCCRMVLDEDLRMKDGTLLVARGVEVSQTVLTRIQNFHARGTVPNHIRVLQPVSVSKWLDVVSPDSNTGMSLAL